MAHTVTSADGTRIAYDRVGSGPTLVLVEASGHFRGFSSFRGLVERLAADFTVVDYDRRGRGESTDTPPYAPEREVEDLAALVAAVGGPAYLYGFSSGALLALRAVAAGLDVPRLALLEPPVDTSESHDEQRAFTAQLAALVEAGDHEGTVEHNLVGVGLPAEVIEQMRGTPAWAAMVSVAPTLVYDCRISEATSLDGLAAVTVPTLVLGSDGSDDELAVMADAVAAALPDAERRSLPGAWHGVDADVLVPVLRDFYLR